MRTSLLLLSLGLLSSAPVLAQSSPALAAGTAAPSSSGPAASSSSADPDENELARQAIATLMEGEVLNAESNKKQRPRLVYVNVRYTAATVAVDFERHSPATRYYYHLLQNPDGKWRIVNRDTLPEVRL